MITSQTSAGWYDDEYYQHIDQFSQRDKYNHELAHLIQLLKISPDDQVLDVGCGTGNAMRYVKSRVGCQISGFEVSPATANFLEGLSVTYGQNSALPFPSESFDCVYSLHVVGHVVNPKEAYDEIRRVLKPGGRFGIITPNYYFIKSLKPLNQLGIIRYKPDPTVLRYYSCASIKRDLERSSFAISYLNTGGLLPDYLRSLNGFSCFDFLRERVYAVTIKQ